MMAQQLSHEAKGMALSILRSNFLRSHPHRAPYQEWFHFWITAPGLDFLVNFSITAEVRATGSPPGESTKVRQIARVVVLAREAGAWDGDAENVDMTDVMVTEGRVFAQMGEHRFSFEEGVFRLRGSLRRRALAFDLVLVPISFPSAAGNASLGASASSLNWLVVPTLLASGQVVIEGRSLALSNALAYHDHNWGGFNWRELSWQWGHATSTTGGEPLSMVFARLLNRAETEVYVQALLLWRGQRQFRVLRNEEIEVTARGRCTAVPFTVPRPAALLMSELAAQVPASFELRGFGQADEIFCRFIPQAIARIAIPSAHDLALTVINESVGPFELRGRVRGEPIQMVGTGVFEFCGVA